MFSPGNQGLAFVPRNRPKLDKLVNKWSREPQKRFKEAFGDFEKALKSGKDQELIKDIYETLASEMNKIPIFQIEMTKRNYFYKKLVKLYTKVWSQPEKTERFVLTLSDIGFHFYELKDYKNALDYFLEAFRTAKEMAKSKFEVVMKLCKKYEFFNKAMYFQTGQTQEAFDILDYFIEIAQEKFNTLPICFHFLMNKKGLVLLHLKEAKKGLKVFRQVLKYSQKHAGLSVVGTKHNIATCHMMLSKYDLAQKTYEKILEEIDQKEQVADYFSTLKFLGDLHFKTYKEYRKALDYYNKCIEFVIKTMLDIPVRIYLHENETDLLPVIGEILYNEIMPKIDQCYELLGLKQTQLIPGDEKKPRWVKGKRQVYELP